MLLFCPAADDSNLKTNTTTKRILRKYRQRSTRISMRKFSKVSEIGKGKI